MFSFLFSTPQIEETSSTTLTTNTFVVPATQNTKNTTTNTNDYNKNSVITPKNSTEKVRQETINTNQVSQTTTPEPAKPSGNSCNGVYYSSCPSNQNLICPQGGEAYCQAPEQPASKPVVQQQNGYQYCSSTYKNSVWDGSSYTNSGEFYCSCTSGYAPSSDGKSCQNLGYIYKGQDGNCYYSNGYDSRGKNLSAKCPVQSQQYSSPSISSACQQAQQTVTDMQNQYDTFKKTSALTLSGVTSNPNVATDVSSGRGQILGKIIAKKDQTYAIAVQNALLQQQIACQ